MKYSLHLIAVIGILALLIWQPVSAAEPKGYTSLAYQGLPPDQKEQYDKLMNMGDAASSIKDYGAAVDYYDMANKLVPKDYVSLGTVAEARLLRLQTQSDLAKNKDKDAKELELIQKELADASSNLETDRYKVGGFQYLDTMARIKTVQSDAYRTSGDIGEAEQAAKEAAQYRKDAETALDLETSYGLMPLDPFIVIAGIAIAGTGLAIRKRRR
jgi:tetratricopeptide (TPR) repeat protein